MHGFCCYAQRPFQTANQPWAGDTFCLLDNVMLLITWAIFKAHV